MDRGAWQATVHGAAKSQDTTRQLTHTQAILSLLCVGVRVCSDFIGLLVAVQLSEHDLLKRLSFFHYIFLPPLLKIN